MSPDEEKVWRRIQEKDLTAFERYYKEHFRHFLLAAYKYLQDTSLAQEVVNDVFLKLWADGDSIQIEISLKSYIYKAVVNRSLNMLDKDRRDKLRQQESNYWVSDVVGAREMEDHELKMALFEAIDRLPEQCRRVFCMSRFEEMKQQAIADRLGISIKTVKNHITHALKELSKVVKDWNKAMGWIVVIKYLIYLHR